MSFFQLKTPKDLQKLLETSEREPVFLLKHSSQCSISAEVHAEYSEFDRQLGADRPCSFALVLVIEERSLSNQVAGELGVEHKSPQLLLISNSKVIWHDSHWRLTLEKMNEVADRYLQHRTKPEKPQARDNEF